MLLSVYFLVHMMYRKVQGQNYTYNYMYIHSFLFLFVEFLCYWYVGQICQIFPHLDQACIRLVSYKHECSI